MKSPTLTRRISILGAIAGAYACADVEDATQKSNGSEVITEARTEDCGACALSLRRILTIGSASGPGTIDSETSVALRDARGRYYIGPEYGQEVDVYDSTGVYLTTIGKEGDGPGEFRMIGSLAFDGADSVHIYDGRSMRHSVYSPEYDYVRSNGLEIRPLNQVLRFGDGASVFSTPVHTPELAGLPLHLLDQSGRHIRSFGSPAGDYDPSVPFGDERVLASEDDSTFWVSYRYKYVIELWPAFREATGPLRTLERRVEWFPEQFKDSGDGEPPPPRLQALRKYGEDQLLVLVLVADPNWEQAVRQGGRHREVTDWQQYWDSLIEIVDLRSAEVVGSIRSEHVFLDIVDDNLLSTVRYTQDDIPVFEVWQVETQR